MHVDDTPIGPDEPDRAVARGGPMDGAILGLADTESYDVRLADRTRWRYVATTDRQELPGGSWGVVFVSAGRL